MFPASSAAFYDEKNSILVGYFYKKTPNHCCIECLGVLGVIRGNEDDFYLFCCLLHFITVSLSIEVFISFASLLHIPAAPLLLVFIEANNFRPPEPAAK